MLYLRKSFISFTLVFTLSTVSYGFAGRNSRPIEEVCKQELPGLENRVDLAVTALTPWVEDIGPNNQDSQDSPNRKIAAAESVVNPESASNLSERDREDWYHWAEDRLHETQDDMDLLAGRPPGRPLEAELTALANEIVSFHGYAQIGDTSRMFSALQSMKLHSAQVRRLACVKK